MARFVMPATVEARIQMHSEMLARVQAGIQQIASMKMKLEPELALSEAQGKDTSELKMAKRNLKLQELCLVDQERRLRERIRCLQIGCSTGLEKAAV